jgi:hypothetical protein
MALKSPWGTGGSLTHGRVGTGRRAKGGFRELVITREDCPIWHIRKLLIPGEESRSKW